MIRDLAPHVAIRLKRCFPKAQPSASTIDLLATPETSDELRWFMDRYPLAADAGTLRELERRADEFVEQRQTVMDLILAREPARSAKAMAIPARPYQELAAELAYVNGGLLNGDEVGLGKTVSGIALLAREGCLPAVVVCPTHLPHQVWRRSIERFLPSASVYVVETTDPKRERKRRGANLAADVLVIPYSRIHGWVDFVQPRTVVFDEVHDLRHQGTRKYLAATEIAGKAERRMGLSATPIFNYGGEFFPVMQILAPGVLGTWDEFKREWCTDGHHVLIRDPDAFGAWLRESGMMLRRSRRDVSRELPPIVRSVIDVEASPPSADNRQVLARLAERVLSGERRVAFESAGQLDAMARKITGLAKANAVAGLVRHIIETTGEPVLLYGWHHEVYDVWMAALEDLKPLLYTGKQDSKAKDAALDKFLAGESKVLMMSLRSGQGVDGLQGVCHRVVFGELDWSPAVHEQCVGRAHRDGQTEPTMVYYAVCDEGADPIMLDVLDIKRGQADPVVDPGGERVLATKVDPEHVKRLAEEILRRG